MHLRRTPRRALAAAVTATVLAVGLSSAFAATVFTDNFDDGDAGGWSKSGGDWSVVTDGSGVLRQSKADSELARQFAGQTSWTDYQVQARVKPLSFGSSSSLVGLAARAAGSTKMYRLALLGSGRAELQAVNGSQIRVIGSASVGAGTGTWYTLRIETSGSTIRGFVNGEDAATFRGGTTYTVDGGGARAASDKVFQHNGSGTVYIRNFRVENAGKLYRACGNCSTSYQRHVVMDNVTATRTGALAGINTNWGDTARFSRITVLDDPDRKTRICVKYRGVPKGDEPTEIGSGADGVNCRYSASDITWR